MPLQRTPLRNIDSNRRGRGPNLTPYDRGQISGMYRCGKTPTEIEAEFGYSRGAIRHTLETLQHRNEGTPTPKSGTPVKYDSRSRRRILRCLRNHPKMTYEQRRESTGLKMSDSYIYRLATENGLTHWRAKKRPELTEAVVEQRLL